MSQPSSNLQVHRMCKCECPQKVCLRLVTAPHFTRHNCASSHAWEWCSQGQTAAMACEQKWQVLTRGGKELKFQGRCLNLNIPTITQLAVLRNVQKAGKCPGDGWDGSRFSQEH